MTTFSRSASSEPTTTHADDRTGAPRLVVKLEDRWEGEGQPVFWLSSDLMIIGSDPVCDIVLPDVERLHSVVYHDDRDEYVIDNCGPEIRVHGAVVEDSAILRTGARIDIGPHTLSFFREEYADHGRPFGGREGGEIGHQRSQPPRPSDEEPAPGR
ncbi:MAG: hypothetical protein JWR90_1862 [Marmoricola sp.]|nr:hypothetical protein [Marmoricola sp.]